MKIRITKELFDKIIKETEYLAKDCEDIAEIISVVIENNFEIIDNNG